MKIKIQSKDGFKEIHINRRRAIRENCHNCSGFNWADVANCNHADCQLYNFRTGQGKQNPKLRSKAILDYCKWCMNDYQPASCGILTCPLYPYRKTATDKSIALSS